MGTQTEGILPVSLSELIKNSKVLVVGAGGIGCELLKNLVLTGFPNIHVIDLDTIEVSNLNRQFLFRREHVGRPKAVVAKESALVFNPNVEITAYHDSITESKYNVNFYKQFTLVMNALDNRAARSHVNRMCLAADLPLVESGSSGFKGHVALYKKGVSECFDCIARPHQKTYPGCTIRNTPSEPIHCIVWSKHLFNQLFGLADPDEDVSPDSADPEAVGNAGNAALEASVAEKNEEKVSTLQWAQSHNYDPRKLFQKLFHDDIKYLLSMENLWKKRTAPTPLDFDNLPDAIASSSSARPETNTGLKDQRIWTIAECGKVFADSVNALRERLSKNPEERLCWDKDDDPAMDFVTACSNIRCHIFGIQQKSRFDTKSMAGNIIPAIASTNAIVAGLMITTAFSALAGEYHKCNTLYLSERLNVKKQLFTVDRISSPNPNCYVCAEKPELILKVDFSRVTIKILGDRILKQELNMVAPDVEIDDGQGTILISSEEGDTDDIADKLLTDFKVSEGTRLKCDDFLQNYELNITLVAFKEEELKGSDKGREKDVNLFEIIGDRSQLHPEEEKSKESAPTASTSNGKSSNNTSQANRNEDIVLEEDDLVLIEPTSDIEEIAVDAETPKAIKRPATSPAVSTVPVKKRPRLPESSNPEVVDLE